MTDARILYLRRAAAAALAVTIGLACAAGCGENNGPSDYDKMVASKKGAADALTQAGAKTQKKQYPVGEAWVVDLRGLTITDDLLRRVKDLGNVAELDLSRSTVTDQQLSLIKELGLQVLLNRLDLSQTAVTDAGLDRLDGFIFLATVDLTGTRVTRAAADRLKQRVANDPKSRIKTINVKMG
jgi:hypothetical protein